MLRILIPVCLLGASSALLSQPACVPLGTGSALPFGAIQAKGIAIKANTDTLADFAWIAPNAAFTVALNTSSSAGPGSFGPPVSFGTAGATDIAAGDFDNDSLEDIALLKAGSIEIWRNLGGVSPTFSLIATAAVTGPFRLQVADLNRDNLPDVGITSSGGLKAFRNLGGSPPSFTLDPVSVEAQPLFVIQDRNGDAIPEIVLASANTVRMFTVTSSVGGPVTVGGSFFGSGGIVAQILRAGDLNGNGSKEVVRTNGAQFLIGQGTAGSAFEVGGNLYLVPAPIQDLDLVDVNADGALDVVAVLTDRVWVGINAVTGASYPTFNSYTLPLTGGSSLITGRFDTDTKLDLLVTGFANAQTVPFLQGSLPMVLTSSTNPVVAGSAARFQVAVFPQAGCAAPAGTIQFSRGATPLGQSPIVDNFATSNVTLTTTGRHTITATYVPSGPTDPFRGGTASLVQFVDSANCASPVSTAQVIRGGVRLDRVTNQFIQQVTVRNNGPTSLTGPAWIALTGLTPGVLVAGAEFAEGCSVPAGTPLVNVNLCSGGSGIPPGGAATVTLRFTSPGYLAFNYTPVVLSGFMAR
ncbi:MAG: VCBS repeat-containing protein [Bryobacterales bacterium]|nr:VCBS repeat-containing protein [Bryobacterales bacterium]